MATVIRKLASYPKVLCSKCGKRLARFFNSDTGEQCCSNCK